MAHTKQPDRASRSYVAASTIRPPWSRTPDSTTVLERSLGLRLAIRSQYQTVVRGSTAFTRWPWATLGRARSPVGGRLGVGLGKLLERLNRPDVLPVEAADDQPAQRAEDDRHGDVQDQPPRHAGAVVSRFDRVVDVHVNGWP